MYNAAMVEGIVKASNGRFLTVEFVKANGDVRKINGRIGVRWCGVPASTRVNANGKAYLLIWEVRTRGYRRVALNRIQRIHTDGLKIAA